MTYKEHAFTEHNNSTAKIKNFFKLSILLAFAFLIILLILPYFEKYMLSK
ncbi:hypothetical protein KHS38_03795 [Mucilaginibacter sp. Bleaf8]|nr:hypothetical protein [Mucilaginibacter sp. Bleaf8]MBS7563519.1 hypothetical protein [Mucilaginibacter sp. Bleaf8]